MKSLNSFPLPIEYRRRELTVYNEKRATTEALVRSMLPRATKADEKSKKEFTTWIMPEELPGRIKYKKNDPL